jgi:Recombination endonuclease VII
MVRMARTGRPKRSLDTLRECPACGGEFSRPSWDKAKFCSLACSFKGHPRRPRCEPGCRCARHIVRISEKSCLHCGGIFTAGITAKFCSRKCGYWFNTKDVIRVRDVQRRWREENPELYREQQQELRRASALRYAKKEREVNPDKWRAADFRRKGKDVLYEQQNGRCYLCGGELLLDVTRAVQLDHDHSCCPGPAQTSCGLCRRGLACKRCNRLIGMVQDNPDLLRRIAGNLETANAVVRQRRTEQQALFTTAAPTKCVYPGCDEPPADKSHKAGPSPVYCASGDHDSRTARTERRRLEREAAGVRPRRTGDPAKAVATRKQTS